ncbi:vitamin K epoxide reductase family protein [Candidatus Dojkabacteria bacterium]|nr:vitamin K epoxide reductase family protein [Candidatus Dojkabacteria bacterium]
MTIMAKKKFIILFILVIIALSSSIYAVILHYKTDTSGSYCNINQVFNCSAVDESEYSEILGVPIGVFGIAYSIFNLTILFVKKIRPAFISKRNYHYVLQLNLLTNTVGIMGSLALTFLLLFIIKAVCINCIIFHVANICYTTFLYKEALQNPVDRKDKTNSNKN